ncbi:DUF3862 domain-containing protein [Aestuariibacter halophilus]|uniref:DUF3862 domain-containing protein n=1 Tax=Fluctibacter halophilus TaxID=226011 RepID=A0ABS8G8Y0_9ALTE|nr:DUF3862 domain-containing protein [Aestuariibacter halophilus]MCC2615661.1 DUF3862 domain-containing protein [Aestuariibacter halophilus]
MQKRSSLFLALSLSLLLAGCSKLTLTNYDQLKMGMTLQEVEDIIGGADSCENTMGAMSCLWGSEDGTYIKISFVADSAVTFSHDGLK